MSTSVQRAEWNVMVFLNAKNNLEAFSFPNFAQMASVGSSDQVNILVEFGRPHQHYSSEFGGWSKTLRFRVTKGMTPTESNAVEDLEQVNMGSGAALTDFVSWARSKFPAKRELLVIWDHGQGWRLRAATAVRGVERERYVALRRELRAQPGVSRTAVPELADHMRLHGGFRYVSLDDDTGDKLYNREIQDALAGLTKTRKIDVIGFDACLMAMLETGYALRRVGRVLVASEELEPGAGWNYARWLQPLVADPTGHDAIKLGRALVSAYHAEYGDNDDATLSAVRLDKVGALARAVSTFAARAKTGLAGQLKLLKQARAASANYAPGYGLNSIDLTHFLTHVSDAPGTSVGVRAAARTAVKAAGGAVVASYASASRKGPYGSHGVAIYFPKSKFAFTSDPDHKGYTAGNTLYPVEFVQREKWAAFLQAYFTRVPS